MANALFDSAREGLLTGAIDWDTAAIKVAMVRGYAYSAAHAMVSDVTGAGGVIHATSAALSSKTAAAGVADAADIVFTAVAANATAHGLLVFQSSAVTGGADVAATAQRVIAWLDSGTGLPVTPAAAGDYTVTWDNGANRIFKL